MSSRLRAAATFGFLGVALGAFGAHALENVLVANDRVETWETAGFYHLVHAVVLLWLAGREQTSATTFWLFAGGIVVFSGSLYLLSVTDIRLLGAITPIGGLALLGGWLLLAVRGR